MKKIKCIFAILATCLLFSTAYSATIESIDAIDNENIRLTASPEVIFSDIEVLGDIRVLRDINVSFARIDMNNSNKVTLNLSHDLIPNFTYNLITAIGAEGDITFSIGDNLVGEIANLSYDSGSKNIEKVNILDSNTLEVYYNYEVTDDFLQYKLLTELAVNSLSSTGDNVLNISLLDPLQRSGSYMIMIASLQDILANQITFDDFLFDFTTSSNLIENTPLEEEVLVEETQVVEEDGNITEVALNVATTPDTGAATWIIMLATFLFSSVFFLKNKFKKS